MSACRNMEGADVNGEGGNRKTWNACMEDDSRVGGTVGYVESLHMYKLRIVA